MQEEQWRARFAPGFRYWPWRERWPAVSTGHTRANRLITTTARPIAWVSVTTGTTAATTGIITMARRMVPRMARRTDPRTVHRGAPRTVLLADRRMVLLAVPLMVLPVAFRIEPQAAHIEDSHIGSRSITESSGARAIASGSKGPWPSQPASGQRQRRIPDRRLTLPVTAPIIAAAARCVVAARIGRARWGAVRGTAVAA